MNTSTQHKDESWLPTVVTTIFAIVILVPSLFGFAMKFREFVMLARGDVDGAFAVTPVMNYLLASLGFFCLLCWAAANGMFRDIEQPKRTMLENEQMLDDLEYEHAARETKGTP